MEQPAGANDAVFSGDVLINDVSTSLTFGADGSLRWSENGKFKCLVVEKEVLGFSIEGSRLVVRCAVVGEGGFLCFRATGSLTRRSFVFEPCSEDALEVWHQKLRHYLDSLDRPKRLLVLVNPFSGNKSASYTYANVVKPLLDDAGIHFTLQETEYQLHAKEVACGLDVTLYDGIVCVSGDGLVVEVVNGLLQRDDWKTAVKMPIGVVPAGSGNGMAKSLLDSVGYPCSAINAVISIIRGHKQPLDVATVLQGDRRFFSVLMLAWGLVADIDIESEKYRWMGSARFDVYALQRILHLRKYQGRVYFVPAPGYETKTELMGEKVNSVDTQSYNPGKQEVVRGEAYLGPNVDADEMNWRVLEGPFVSVWLHNVPWGAEGAKPAPDAKFSDGYIDLIVITDCPKMALLSLITEVSSGNHIKSPYVLYIKVKAFILEPGPRKGDPTMGGIIDCDGEVLARGDRTYMCEQKTLMDYDKLQVTIDQGLATLFAPLRFQKPKNGESLATLETYTGD